MTPLDLLIKHFEQFPGIGSRQARRFAFHLLTLPSSDLEDLATLIHTIHTNIVLCLSCYRFHTSRSEHNLCRMCSNTMRDNTKLMVVERDSDIDALERGGVYDGLYFVLGGTVPLLDSQDTKKLRGTALKHTVETRLKNNLSEIILAFSVNPDGENTTRYVEMLLKEYTTHNTIRITHLGRGLSTGSELEYADSETIKNAFRNRN
jgi:recombination protein RecR